MFESNNITITGKSAVLSILYTVVTRQNKQPKEEIKTHTHSYTFIISTLQKWYENKTRSPESKATPPLSEACGKQSMSYDTAAWVL